jgi:nucleotide-binding universal stress UspA family protein
MAGILHATDFSEGAAAAFEHALALALDLGEDLTLLHAGAEAGRDVPWDRFPHVRETLARWGHEGGDEGFRARARDRGEEARGEGARRGEGDPGGGRGRGRRR